ncbi:uncharacterized protein si:dkey-1h24.6 isoform X2 [Kryptolebias marmoratus]|uniref:uncharacterized protein si:dkey-1h24.6 isoform X2 n=1 Tax=Kryptolebias marmoratus TaxID=37003 RepID=UPI0007F8CA02|nr:uncharacterized protein si:dkey-1h24.6 isoform X2 [Kryptolebias marmoratus]
MGVRWMLVVLLSCTSSHASLHQRPRESKGQQLQIRCLNTLSPYQPMFVPCPNVTTGDATLELFENQNIICQLGTRDQKECNRTQMGVKVVRNSNQVEGFNITGPVSAKSQAVYRCKATITFPPPIKYLESDLWILILTDDHCSCNKGSRNEEVTEGSNRLLWIWITAVSLLSTYSLAVTVVALIVWFKLKGSENQNDYMNAKPRAPRKHKKKRGVQTPIPRHF